jgi:hypothetical protein
VPATLEAVTVFVLLFAPGFMLTRGYLRGRAHTLPQRDVYTLAQGVIASVFVIAAAWLLGGDVVLDWVQDETIDEHRGDAAAVLLGLLTVPYLVGRTAGAVIDRLGDSPQSLPMTALSWMLDLDAPSAWDDAWLRAYKHDWALVSVELVDGRLLTGLYAGNSIVDLAPNPRQVFLEREYRYVDGQLVAVPGSGLFIDGSQITAIHFDGLGPAS